MHPANISLRSSVLAFHCFSSLPYHCCACPPTPLLALLRSCLFLTSLDFTENKLTGTNETKLWIAPPSREKKVTIWPLWSCTGISRYVLAEAVEVLTSSSATSHQSALLTGLKSTSWEPARKVAFWANRVRWLWCRVVYIKNREQHTIKLLTELNIQNSILLIELRTPNNPFQSLRQRSKPVYEFSDKFIWQILTVCTC